jgi:hypothetical protein
MKTDPGGREQISVEALKVHQWLGSWDQVQFDPSVRRRKPAPHFYLCTLSAATLRALTGISRRKPKRGEPRSEDIGIQRRHEVERSKRIAEFVRYGYPWSELREAKRKSGEFDDLRKPGWLPTAIVVNVLTEGDVRRGARVDGDDLVRVQEVDEWRATLVLPVSIGTDWRPKVLHPIEVIDGQHRLWAFEQDESLDGGYQLPVVAFHGLDVSWQAYLFWSINITPKRINASLAFDLYPLLRTEDWLERFEGHSVYRETRAQELTEALWAHPLSPWCGRINMLGESGLNEPMVTQAAWIRSLLATYVKSWEGRRVTIGGLFGAPVGANQEALPWSRAQQAAFLIYAGSRLRHRVELSDAPWTRELKSEAGQLNGPDLAFFGAHSLLSTDQGIRGFLAVTNDLCYVRADQLGLGGWVVQAPGAATDQEAVSEALDSLQEHGAAGFLDQIAELLANYDWKTSSAPGLTDDERLKKAAFRGSGGYKELRRQLLQHLAGTAGQVGQASAEILKALKY